MSDGWSAEGAETKVQYNCGGLVGGVFLFSWIKWLISFGINIGVVGQILIIIIELYGK